MSLLFLVIQDFDSFIFSLNLNLCKKLTNNDLEIHQNRFSNLITEVVKISLELKDLAINYNPKRIQNIIIILTKIKNYNNETIKNS